ncbi:MAG: protein BatD [Chloroflexi bacterium]|nr:protein BatD [Chloroflexota bacterium]
MLLASAPGASAQPTVRAEIDKTSLSTDDTLLLTIIVTGDFQRLSPPTLPAFEGFDVVGTSYSSATSLVNGRRSFEGRYLYQLRPIQLGRLTIDPVEVTIDGQSYRTEPLPVEVLPGSLPTPPPGAEGPFGSPDERELWVEASVDTPTPYVGQALSYTFHFLQTYRLGLQPSYEAPDFRGFLSESPAQRVFTTRIGTRNVRVIELRHVLFPTRPGAIEIGPARFTIPASLGRGPLRFVTDPVALTVRPLPDGAPQGFAGAVGRFSIEVELPDTPPAVGSPSRLLIRVKGEGNIAGLPEPQLPELPAGWQSYAGDQAADQQVDDGRVSGGRVYERFLVPGSAGPVDLGPLRYPYFDPESERYQVAESAPLRFDVAPGLAVDLGTGAEPVSAPPIRAVPADLARPVGLAPWQLLLLSLAPLAVVAIDRAWQRRNRSRRQAEERRAARASTRALDQLERPEARSAPERGATQAIETYLALRLGLAPGGSTRRQLLDGLQAAEVDPSLRARVEAWLASLDGSRFARREALPPAGGANPTARPVNPIAEARALLQTLDAGWPE